jgi:hypothetical protein
MELRKFVGDALLSILDGVADAQGGERGQCISPPFTSAPQGSGLYRVGDELAFAVNFDIAVTVTESDAKEGGGKIAVFSTSIGGRLKSQNEQSTVSRISFAVPVIYPRQG